MTTEPTAGRAIRVLPQQAAAGRAIRVLPQQAAALQASPSYLLPYRKNFVTLQKIPFMSKIKAAIQAIGRRLAALPPRMGVIALILCALFYAVSFLQMLLPISAGAKAVLWVIFFGLAKTAQYTAVAILSKEGIRLLWRRFRRRK